MNIRKFLNQNAVYWPPVDKDDNGNIVYGKPKAMKVRIVPKTKVRSTPLTDIYLPEATILSADLVEEMGMIAMTTLDKLKRSEAPGDNGAIAIRTIAPFIDRGGNVLGWELTTTAQFTLSRAGTM